MSLLDPIRRYAQPRRSGPPESPPDGASSLRLEAARRLREVLAVDPARHADAAARRADDLVRDAAARLIGDPYTVDDYLRRLLRRLIGDDTSRADGRCALPPKWLILGVNNVCNLRCRMCDIGLGDDSTVFWANLIGDDPRNMSLELLLEVLHQARGFHPRPKIGLAFTEPLIHPRIVDFVKAIVGAGFFASITSNGTTLPRHAEALIDAGLHELNLSVDGPAEVHNRIRGGRESFQKLYRGVEALHEARGRRGVPGPRLTFSFTVTDQNQRHILEFVKAIEPLRPDRIVISQQNFISDEMAAAHNARYHGDLAVVRSNLGEIDPASFDTAGLFDELERVRAYARSRGPGFPALVLVPDVTSIRTLDTFYREPRTFVSGRRCTDPWELMMVRTDGTVIPAHGRCFNFTVGRIDETPLPSIWNSDRFMGLRRTLLEAGGTLPACSRCCGVIGKPVSGNGATRAPDGVKER
jgi:MoaA/NifB/PqqE/SkfB family radical SAM enzyme